MILKLLDEALEFISEEVKTKEVSIQLKALRSRLRFRQKFLEFVSDASSSIQQRCALLETCRELLPQISESMGLGKAVPKAFSTRIQRKLSIQVPPRPMVSIDPKEASQLFRTLLENLIEIEGIYNYKSPHEIIVRFLQGG